MSQEPFTVAAEDFSLIDMVQNLAEQNDWNFDRNDDDQIVVVVESNSNTYNITLASAQSHNNNQTLRCISHYDLEVDEHVFSSLCIALNAINGQDFSGHTINYWEEHKLMMIKSVNVFPEDYAVKEEWISQIINDHVNIHERHRLPIQMVLSGEHTVEEALFASSTMNHGGTESPRMN